jgi:thiamine pyrophosphate-dependent acetolactate synthase large subunit-like protein
MSSAIGIGLPGAIAAKLARPERSVVAVTGDGGLLMNVQELETAVRLGLGFVVLIFRDDGYGVIRSRSDARHRSDRIGERDHAAGLLDVQVLDQTAVEQHHATPAGNSVGVSRHHSSRPVDVGR